MKEKYEFDFDDILDEFRSGKKLTGKGGLLAPLIKPSKKYAQPICFIEVNSDEIY